MLIKSITVHLFSHFLDHVINLRYFPNQKCHDSNNKNLCNDSSKGFLLHKILPHIIWKIIYIQTTSDYFSFEPMDQPCTSETWSRTQSSWPYKISAEQKWQHERFTVFLMAMNYVDSQQYQVFMLTKGLLPRNFYWLNHQGIKTVLYKKTWNSSGSGDERCE